MQELAEGRTLAELVKDGWRGSQEEVGQIAVQLLGVLQYLGSRLPPVVHRDLNPNNVILANGSRTGRVFLVDFGGVQAAAAAADGGSFSTTVVGSYGFMAPEQARLHRPPGHTPGQEADKLRGARSSEAPPRRRAICTRWARWCCSWPQVGRRRGCDALPQTPVPWLPC